MSFLRRIVTPAQAGARIQILLECGSASRRFPFGTFEFRTFEFVSDLEIRI